ncbi:MAG: class I SAM-dependent methyltransferase [Gemmataceae bacterium]
MKSQHVADWQLPAGINRGLWDYSQSSCVANNYDENLKDCPLLQLDLRFVKKHCSRPGRLIDLGCGTGRVSVPMAQMNHEVLAVDLSQDMLRVVGKKAGKVGIDLQRLRINLVELDGIRDGVFDYAVCLFSTIGMILGQENRLGFLRHAHRILKPQGRMILHVHNRWFNFWTRQGRQWVLRDLWRSVTRSPDQGDSEMPPHNGHPPLTLHLFTRREMTQLLKSTGFRLVEFRPISVREDGEIRWNWWFSTLRAYGYLIVADKTGS